MFLPYKCQMNYIHSLILNGTENPSFKHISLSLVIVWFKIKTRGPWVTTLTWGRFLNVFNIILKFHYNLPLEADSALHFTQRSCGQCLVEIGPVIQKKKILKYFQCHFTISLSSPLKKSIVLHLNKFESLPAKDA